VTSATSPSSPLAPYRIFEGTVQRGPHKGFTLDGPLVLGYNGRIQVNGFLFQQGGPRITVVGTVFAGGVNLRFVLPGKTGVASVYVTGSGQLRGVRGGLQGGLTLVGSGNLSGPSANDFGHWVTLAPSRA
jgi:hypothetical protein